MKQIDAKLMKKIHAWLRAAIQLAYFVFFPSVYAAAFSGVKYIFTQIGAGNYIGLTAFISALLVLCVYTILFGRFFCGFACAFGTLGDAVRALYVWLCKKMKKKPVCLPEKWAVRFSYLKYIILAGIVLLCFAGSYAKLHGTSPWEVFSLLHAGNFKLGGYALGILFFFLILLGMCVQERFFCRFLCPMGALFSMLPVLPVFSLHRSRENCIKGCSACSKNCPSAVELPDDGSLEPSGDCFMCQKCIDMCPKKNIHTGIRALRGNEIWFTLIRAIILLALFLIFDI